MNTTFIRFRRVLALSRNLDASDYPETHRITPRALRGALFALLLVSALGSAPLSRAALNGRIAYVKYDDFTLWVYDTATQQSQQVTDHSGAFPNAWSTDWTPDGEWIVFAGGPGGQAQVYAVRPDGSGIRRITDGTGNIGGPVVSPDGTTVVYHQAYGDLFSIALDGTGRVSLGWGIQWVSWSPGGENLVGTDWAYGGRYNSDLWIWNLDDGSRTKITNRPDGTAFHIPVWSRDGSKIAAQFYQNGNWDIVLMNADGSGIVNLTFDWDSSEWHPAWSHDGQYLLFISNHEGSQDIWFMHADGSNRTKLIAGNGAPLELPAMTSSLPQPDTTPPIIQCPGNIVAGTDLGQCSAVVGFSVSSTDDSGSVTIVCDPPSGSAFPKGSTTVNCSATDAAGNIATCSFTVTVQDLEPPTIICPADIAVGCSIELLVPVSFTVSATDNCDAQPTVICHPPSGTGFSVGVTTVTCTATDEAGNTSTCTFTVTRAPLGFTGFLPPIGGADATGGSFLEPVRTFKLGSTIPVKFTASCGGTPITTGIHRLQVIKYSDATNSADPIDASPQGAATTGNQFRLADDHWHFNLDTRATGMAKGIWQLVATLSDGSQHRAWIQVK